MFPHVTELEFPVRIQESLVEAWVNTLASGQTIGREHSLPHQQKIGFKITEDGPTNQSKAQFPSESLSPIRKLPYLSYPYS